MPPPARLAVLPVTDPPVIETTPPVLLKMPPPLPLAPSATLPVIVTGVAVPTLKMPPLLKIPPPPSSAASPLAVLPLMVVPSTVIVPLPFHSPPPSRAAVLPLMVPPVITTSPLPVTCKPPPFPGSALPTGPAMLLDRSVLMSETDPAVVSIPPPARLATFGLAAPDLVTPISASLIDTVPALKMPPPLPLVPVAWLPDISIRGSEVPPVPSIVRSAPAFT